MVKCCREMRMLVSHRLWGLEDMEDFNGVVRGGGNLGGDIETHIRWEPSSAGTPVLLHGEKTGGCA